MKYVYPFDAGVEYLNHDLMRIFGAKGATLMEMTRLGLPVPPGFTITTDVGTYYNAHWQQFPNELRDEVQLALARLEETIGSRFGSDDRPLLVSVRASAPIVMPGMLDTVLNLGLNDETVEGLAKRSNNPRFAYDSYRRFIQMYGQVVLGVEHHHFEELLENHKLDTGATLDTELTAEDWKTVVAGYKDVVQRQLGEPFPQDPQKQLWGAIGAVFGSWMNQRAITYRRLHGIPADWGTAVNVQGMVFGNMGDDCATGVAFTRNPSTGVNEFYGEYLVNAQGEDVVAGIRTPQHLTIAGKQANKSTLPAMEEVMPEIFGQLAEVRTKLETHYRDMQDIEFTVQQGKLWMLQTWSGKRTAPAALKIAVDMANEGLIDRNEAVKRINPPWLDDLFHPTFDPKAQKTVLARGLPASPGAASGIVVFSAAEAEKLARAGRQVILVGIEFFQKDIDGMHAARGILTTRGGMTSHAAVLARGMRRSCVVGAGDIRIDYTAQALTVRDVVVNAGEFISINGGTGEVLLGEIPLMQPSISGDCAAVMAWADEARTMRVWAQCRTPEDTKIATTFGADGITLFHTDEIFLNQSNAAAVHAVAKANDDKERLSALGELSSACRTYFTENLTIAAGMPVSIRLLDISLGAILRRLRSRLASCSSDDGQLDQAGVNWPSSELIYTQDTDTFQLAITHADIHEMQCHAIFEATADAYAKGNQVNLEIVIPFLVSAKELHLIKSRIKQAYDRVVSRTGIEFEYAIGAGIDVPCAAFISDELVDNVQSVVFGADHITRAMYGLLGTDVSQFFLRYLELSLISHDPLLRLDWKTVGQLIQASCSKARGNRREIVIGLSGQQTSDPASVRFCHDLGISYISCQPKKLLSARLAAAQAALEPDA